MARAHVDDMDLSRRSDASLWHMRRSYEAITRTAPEHPAVFCKQYVIGAQVLQNGDRARFLEQLERASDSSRPGTGAERCFLDWNEAREMQQAGMAFGSHTHNHEILSKLPVENQLEELTLSREILEQQLGRKIDTLAYPVGARDTFSAETVEALRQAKYRAAFSFYAGFNAAGSIAPFDIRRCGVDQQSRKRLRLQTAIGSHGGGIWF